MKGRLFVVITVVMALATAWITPAMSEAKHVEGQIQQVDPSGNIVILADGTELIIADTVDRAALKPGAMVRLAYEEKGGRKLATSVEVKHPER
jgi:hypothetical protein